jgi:hypothetical protein
LGYNLQTDDLKFTKDNLKIANSLDGFIDISDAMEKEKSK